MNPTPQTRLYDALILLPLFYIFRFIYIDTFASFSILVLYFLFVFILLSP